MSNVLSIILKNDIIQLFFTLVPSAKSSRHSSNMKKLIVTTAIVGVALLVIVITCIIAVMGALAKKRRTAISRQAQPLRIRHDTHQSCEDKLSQDRHSLSSNVTRSNKSSTHDHKLALTRDLKQAIARDNERKSLSGFSFKAPSTISQITTPFYESSTKCVFNSNSCRSFGLNNAAYNWYSYWTKGLKAEEEANLTFCEEDYTPIPRPQVKPY